MNKNKGFTPILITIAILAVLTAGGIGYYTVKNLKTTSIIKGDNSQQQLDQTKILVSKNTNNVDTQDLIIENQIGLFHIGEPIPDQTLLSQAKYSIKETTIFPEGMPQKQFIVSKDSKDLLTFELSPDLSKIWDIEVVSPEFKTKEGIGTGSTIADFIKAYPNYMFWYSEEEGEHFVLYTSSDKQSPAFLLDRSGLLDPKENFYYTKIKKAQISDFSDNAKISSVRVLYMPK